MKYSKRQHGENRFSTAVSAAAGVAAAAAAAVLLRPALLLPLALLLALRPALLLLLLPALLLLPFSSSDIAVSAASSAVTAAVTGIATAVTAAAAPFPLLIYFCFFLDLCARCLSPESKAALRRRIAKGVISSISSSPM